MTAGPQHNGFRRLSKRAQFLSAAKGRRAGRNAFSLQAVAVAEEAPGLGLTVTQEDGAVKVIAPQEDTPAARAGIKSGDYITNIDGKLLYGGTLDDAVQQMRGKPGSKVTLTIIRPGHDKPIEVTLTREVIVTKPVKWEVKGQVGYININTFSEATGADTRAAIQGIDKALGHRPLGYVVDLRDNGGGLLTQAIAVSAQSCPTGVTATATASASSPSRSTRKTCRGRTRPE